MYNTIICPEKFKFVAMYRTLYDVKPTFGIHEMAIQAKTCTAVIYVLIK
jgi:hypothetical protein